MAVLGQDCAASRQYARQFVIFQQLRRIAAQQPVGMLGKASKVTVELLIPVGEATFAGKMFHLIDEARAQAAAVYFL